MCSSVLTALSNTVRLQLISCLGKKKMNVNGLIKNCGLSQSAVSQHLAKLRDSGLVSAEKEGREVFYKLNYPKTVKVGSMLQEFIKEVEK